MLLPDPPRPVLWKFRIKNLCLLLALLTFSQVAFGQRLTPSRLDPSLGEARQKAFIPWGGPAESGAYWQKLAGSNVPVLNERKTGGLSRDLYVPNPGLGYWVLGDLSEQTLWRVQREKLKIGDELVSASVYQNEAGADVYWALWAPKDKAYLLKDKMRELGIAPAQVDMGSNEPFSGRIVFHQADGHITYDLAVTNGKVSGCQRMSGADKPIAQIVGGWFDYPQGRLSVLVQCTDEMDPKWRSRAQQFEVDPEGRKVTLKSMLYDFGLTLDNSEIPTAHVLDTLDKTVNLIK